MHRSYRTVWTILPIVKDSCGVNPQKNSRSGFFSDVTLINIPLTKEECNEAIVKLYEEGWKQETLSLMWSIDQGQISRIIGAEERTKKICQRHKIKKKLAPGEEGWKQEALAEMWNINQSQISFIIGAAERTERILPGNNQKLTSTHEKIIRRAPEERTEKVGLPNSNKKPKKKGLTVALTHGRAGLLLLSA